MQVIFGVTDPRTHEIKQIAQVKEPKIEGLRDYFNAFFVEPDDSTNQYNVWLRDLRAVGLKPSFVILERNAGEGAKARWISLLRAAGTELTNMRNA